MGTFTKGDIVLFPFPYTDLSNRKIRPCLVISNEAGYDILLCQITSKKIKKNRYVVELKKDSTINGSLHIDSYIRPNMIFTSAKMQIIKKICQVPEDTYTQVVNTILDIIKK